MGTGDKGLRKKYGQVKDVLQSRYKLARKIPYFYVFLCRTITCNSESNCSEKID